MQNVGGNLRELTVSAAVPRLIVELLTSDRSGQEEVYRRSGLDVRLLDDIDSRVPHDAFRRFSRVAEELSEDPTLGLEAARTFFPSIIDVVSFTVLSSETLLQALQTIATYSPLVDESVEVGLRRHDATAELEARWPTRPPSALIVNGGVATVLRILRLLAAGRPLRVESAKLSVPEPADRTKYVEVLECEELTFGEPLTTITFREDDLNQHIPKPSGLVSQFMRELADSQLDFLKNASLTSIKVREIIARGLGGNPPMLGSVASVMRMSPRSLQRSLEREGARFRSLADDAQRQKAHRLLRYSHKNLKEIAFELGFNETRSFQRSSLRWFGRSPAAYRNGGRGAVAD